MESRRQTAEPCDKSAEVTDQQLLAAYRGARTPEAFRRIIDRHGPMVLRAAHRLVGNWHDAEDVAQAVFLVLARRAGSVNQTLGGWLHKVTQDVSLQLLRAKARRARREEAAVKSSSKPGAADTTELREEIDCVLVQLPNRLREAVVLRYLEGRGQEEAARMAGCDKGTLSRRCTDGLNRLGSLLARRGLVVAPAMLAGFLSGQSVGSLPAATLQALSGIGAGSVAASASAAGLAKGTLQAMFWVKAKLCAAVVVSVAAVGAVTPLVIPSSPPPGKSCSGSISRTGSGRPFASAGRWSRGPSGPVIAIASSAARCLVTRAVRPCNRPAGCANTPTTSAWCSTSGLTSESAPWTSISGTRRGKQARDTIRRCGCKAESGSRGWSFG